MKKYLVGFTVVSALLAGWGFASQVSSILAQLATIVNAGATISETVKEVSE